MWRRPVKRAARTQQFITKPNRFGHHRQPAKRPALVNAKRTDHHVRHCLQAALTTSRTQAHSTILKREANAKIAIQETKIDSLQLIQWARAPFKTKIHDTENNIEPTVAITVKLKNKPEIINTKQHFWGISIQSFQHNLTYFIWTIFVEILLHGNRSSVSKGRSFGLNRFNFNCVDKLQKNSAQVWIVCSSSNDFTFIVYRLDQWLLAPSIVHKCQLKR